MLKLFIGMISATIKRWQVPIVLTTAYVPDVLHVSARSTCTAPAPKCVSALSSVVLYLSCIKRSI